MARVSNVLVLELQTNIREDYGRDLPMADVSLIANDLVGYFDLLAKLYRQDRTHSQEPETSA